MTGIPRSTSRLAFCVPLLVTVSLASLALGLGGKYGDRKIGKSNADWSDVLVQLIDAETRVDGHFVNANDEFFYRGDTAAFNEFLKLYARLEDTPLTVVIHSETRRRSALWGDDPKTPYDWKLLLLRKGWGAPEVPGFDGKYVATIDVWVDGGVELEEIYRFGLISPLVASDEFKRSR